MIVTRFFSSFEEGDPQPVAGSPIGPGPARSPTAKTGVGFTGLKALRYRAPEEHRAAVFEVDIPVTADTELSYVVFPEWDDEARYRGTFAALDVEFDDGSTLGSWDDATTLYPDQWNLVRRPLGASAGKRVKTIVLAVTPPPGPGAATGWIDDVRIAERHHERRDAVDWVRTTRGTHSSGEFSRGNTFPATAVPNGFNFWTPVTDASSTTWRYEYHRRNNEQNRPALEGFALSHQPSPWMGDRHTFHLMPGTGALHTGPLAFTHDHETDRPYYYAVRFDNGIVAELAPADHAAIFRFTFPAGSGWVRFSDTGGLRINRSHGTFRAYTTVRSRLSKGAGRMFIYGTTNAQGRPPAGGGAGYLSFDAPTVEVRIATSLIGLDQARRNLDQEIPAGMSFEQVRKQARAQWQDLLGRVELDGAGDDELTTFYSCLYRLFLYPNSGHEQTPQGRQHASPVIRHRRPSTRKRTGARVLPGPMSVNNGFWDTYRTAWPLYALLAPRRCGELIDGFVRQYREGGWIARWSSPGYADLMTGTSSDVAFADAYLKGVRDFDVEGAYEAALRNATVPPEHRGVGRKGLHESIFLGYTPTTTPEGLSWALEGCINDFGLANFAEALGRHDDARYFRQRSLHYVNHFDPHTGFFQGRHPNGAWRWTPDAYDPRVWGFDYTETNGWNTAFSVPHDGRGLANLLGGREALESKMDTFFATPETGRRPGSYGGIIHEMTEARDMRMGQYGHSNQPSHHIPFMYLHAAAPAKAQAVVREVLTRRYTGSDIGQGYPGDEDNGEMSAWYVFAALGLYPLAVGSPVYVLGAPLFPKATIHLENGNDVVITASTGRPGEKPAPFVRGLRVNGAAHERAWITHEELTAGALLDFETSATPTEWGTPPPSLTKEDAPPCPLTDLTGHATSDDGTNVTALFDDTSRTQVVFRSRRPTIEYTVDGPPRQLGLYTLTSGTRGAPAAWTLEGSADGQTWTVLDERSGETFRWRRQTRPFAVGQTRQTAWQRYRLRVTGTTGGPLSLTQWELLCR